MGSRGQSQGDTFFNHQIFGQNIEPAFFKSGIGGNECGENAAMKKTLYPLDEEQIASMNPYEKSAPRIRERFVFESEWANRLSPKDNESHEYL